MFSTGAPLSDASMVTMAGLAIVATAGAFADPEWYAEKRTAIFTIASLILLGWLVWGTAVTYRVLMSINDELILRPDAPLSTVAGRLNDQANAWASLWPLLFVGLGVLIYLGILERKRKASTQPTLPDWLRVSRRIGHVVFDGLLGWIVRGATSALAYLRDGLSYRPDHPLHEFGWMVSDAVRSWRTLFPIAVVLGVLLIAVHLTVRVRLAAEPAIAA